MAMSRLAVGVLLAFTMNAHAGLGDLLKSAEDVLKSNQSAPSSGLGAGLSDGEIGGGLKEALGLGAERAIALLGASGGYLNDPQVRIPLPGMLDKAGKGLRAVGYGNVVDEFETTVNRAAEQAIPQTLEIVKKAVKDMSWQDVRGILNGGDDAATKFLRERAGGDMFKAVLPIVQGATEKAGATSAYKNLKGQVDSSLGGLVSTKPLDLDNYVTEKTLDGLFLKLAAEEKKIRENPVARSTELLKKVFAGS